MEYRIVDEKDYEGLAKAMAESYFEEGGLVQIFAQLHLRSLLLAGIIGDTCCCWGLFFLTAIA